MDLIVSWLVHAVLFAGATVALGSAGLRVATAAGVTGLPRALAAAPIAVTAACLWGLLLGLAGLGGSAIALSLGALATFLAVRHFASEPTISAWQELAQWWVGLSRAARAGWSGVAAVMGWWAAWLLKAPLVEGDATLYHLPKVAIWVQSGRPGSEVNLFVDNPFGAYPGSNELVLAWASAIARNMVPLTLWMVPAMIGLLVIAIWVGATSLGAPRKVGAALSAAVATGPVLVTQANGPNTDLPALAWLACATALAAVAVTERRPKLAPVVVLAVALAVGTKATVAPLAFAVLGVVVWKFDRPAVVFKRAVSLAIVAGGVVGGLWYLRNAVRHGSPLWPFVSLPWGDPVPPALMAIDGRALLDPADAVLSRVGVWEARLAGQLLIVMGALLAPVVVRRRAVAVGALITFASVLLWAQAPATGFPADSAYDTVAASALRYLTPALVPAVATLAVAAAANSRAARAIFALAVVATAYNVVRDISVGFPYLPGLELILVGAAGVGVGALGGHLRYPGWLPRPSPALATGSVMFALVAVLVAAGPIYVDRHLETFPSTDRMLRKLAANPGFIDGHQPVAMVPHLEGMAAGRTLSHSLELVGTNEPCRSVRERSRKGFLLVDTRPRKIGVPAIDRLKGVSASQIIHVRGCLTGVKPLSVAGPWRIYGPSRQ